MVRFTVALAESSKSPDNTVVIEEVVTDIYHEEQLTEHFLLHVNPKGQVPALTSSALKVPLADSLDITSHLYNVYPQLAPQPHRPAIEKLLKQLHEISYLSLSFTPQQGRAKGISIAIDKILEKPDISKEYRKALEFKANYHEKTLVHALEPDWIAKAENQARDFLQEIGSLRLRHGHGSPWIYGDQFGPTALDAHTVVFIARLFDANRADLMTEDIQTYARSIMDQPAFMSVMDGRPTLHSLWVKEQKS